MRWKSKSWKQFYHTQKMEETRGDLTTDKFSLMFTGTWLSRLCPHKSLQAWNANKRKRLGLPTPKRYLSVYERKHIETVRELTIPVYDRLRLRSEALNAQVVLVYKLKRTSCENGFIPINYSNSCTALFVWIAQIKSNQSITLFNHGVLFT